MEQYTVAEAKEHVNLWDPFREHFPRLSDKELAVLVSIALDACPYCLDGKRGCRCWDDS